MSAMTSVRRRRLLTFPVLAMVLVGCGDDDNAEPAGGGPPAGSGTEVVIRDFSFDPSDIEVAPGTTVTWTNKDGAAHTVKDSGELFPESDELAQGDTFAFTYDTPGEYPYICGIHQYMEGTVTVA